VKPWEWNLLGKAIDGGAPIKQMSKTTFRLLMKTFKEESHPDNYNGPCICKTCQSYADA
jgi:hypothetical protein